MAIFYFPEPDCVFIHIHKTGGASIRHGFFKGANEPVRFGAMPVEWQTKFSFAFVRNPFDRVISCWKMFTQGMEESVWEYPEDGQRSLTLKDSLKIAMDESVIYDARRKTFAEKLRHHAIPQTHPFNCLDQAKVIGRFERFEEDFARICEHIGIPPGPLPHMNRTSHGGYRDYFDRETRALVESYYAEDLERFDYAF